MPDTPPKILVFAGSARSDSFNKKLAAAAAEFARDAGAETNLVDLRDFPMPLYDGDLEQEEGMPAPASAFKKLLCECDGMLIASPEYNSSLSPLLKNAIDWASRSESDSETPMRAFDGKAAGIMAASPGKLGGMRGLVHLRSILENIGVMVIPDQIAVGSAFEVFDDEGKITSDFFEKKTRSIAEQLVALAGWSRSRSGD